MKCNNCGKSIAEESQFCNFCGQKQIRELQGQNEQHELAQVISINSIGRAKKYFILGLILIIVVIMIRSPITRRNKQYNSDIDKIQQGNIYEGVDILYEIKDKKKSDIEEFVTRHTEELCAANKYIEADAWVNQVEYKQLLAQYSIIELKCMVDYSEAEYMVSQGAYIDAYYKFIQLGDYKNSEEQGLRIWEENRDMFYELAVSNVESGQEDNIKIAKSQFAQLADYKDSVEWVNKINAIEKFAGMYIYGTYSKEKPYWIVNGLSVTLVRPDSFSVTAPLVISEYNGKYCLVDEPSEGMREYGTTAFLFNSEGVPERCKVMVDKDNKIYRVIDVLQNYYSMDEYYHEKNRRDPEIGMTAEEVRESTWGEPKDINKTTYTWGVAEQWVYSGYRYIYLNDGIVTAIQE